MILWQKAHDSLTPFVAIVRAIPLFLAAYKVIQRHRLRFSTFLPNFDLLRVPLEPRQNSLAARDPENPMFAREIPAFDFWIEPARTQ